MAHQAASSSGGNKNNNNNENKSDDVSSVYGAVEAGETAARVRELIEAYAYGEGARTRRSYEEWRSAAVNYKSSANGNETLLEAAHNSDRGDLVGALLESGADAKALGPEYKDLALTIRYGQIYMRSGRHHANERMLYSLSGDDCDCHGFACSPAHAAIIPQRRYLVADRPPPCIDALEILVREFGADVNGRDEFRRTPLHWASIGAPGRCERAVDELFALGADLEALDKERETPIFQAALTDDPSVLLRLLSLGASADVVSTYGFTVLMNACFDDKPSARVAVPALVRASSLATRRTVQCFGDSAIDYLVKCGLWTQDWCQDVIGELLSSGAPVKPAKAAIILPIAARHGTRLERRWAAHENEPPPWQMHEAMVELAIDFQDVRAAEEGVTVHERRVRELEEALRACAERKEDNS